MLSTTHFRPQPQLRLLSLCEKQFKINVELGFMELRWLLLWDLLEELFVKQSIEALSFIPVAIGDVSSRNFAPSRHDGSRDCHAMETRKS